MIAYGFDGNQGSKARTIGFEEEVVGTLEAGKVKHVLCLNDQGGNVMSVSENKTGTLRAEEHGHQPVICIQGNCINRADTAGCAGKGWTEDKSFTLNTIDRPAVYDQSVHHGYKEFDDVSETVKARYGTGGNNQPLVVAIGNGQAQTTGIYEKCPTLSTMHDQQAIMCYQNTGQGWWNEGQVSATLRTPCGGDSTKANLVAAVDCRNVTENQACNGTLQAKSNGGWNANSQNCVRQGQYVRRLTPRECERLQGYPDGWTDIPGASDAKRYRALGNSIALPAWEFWARRFVEMGGVKTIGSLFDGIGGFPLVFKRAGAETLWTSEIEPFCQKVVEYHFGNEEAGEEGDVWKYVK